MKKITTETQAIVNYLKSQNIDCYVEYNVAVASILRTCTYSGNRFRVRRAIHTMAQATSLIKSEAQRVTYQKDWEGIK